MTIEEAIKHTEEVADYDCYNEKQIKCAEEHRQLAEWLKDYKKLLGVIEDIKADIQKQNIADFIAVQSVLDIINKHTSGKEDT